MRYRSECWPINVNDIKKMLQIISGKTLKDGVKRKLMLKRHVLN